MSAAMAPASPAENKRPQFLATPCHFLPTSWLTPTLRRPANIARWDRANWRCELHQQDRWEARSFAVWLTGFHGKRNLHILGWLIIIDPDSFSHSHIQSKACPSWHHKHLCSTESRICQIMGNWGSEEQWDSVAVCQKLVKILWFQNFWEFLQMYF